ncbi:protein serine/threonine kinase, putative [Entamoeba invadens IP1]|uniref:Protein serine/threonine kinase, putative n=1 Tax=Entamoeba invadens IP1 TaxID=370355 RepID=A0A0A1TXQ1_ENTIV|nr:protein serine/threonine kinase, putative [Entamoeba invadens IP1]ELP86152.1 protein serine/threonine kinase, putative [Entamoeba invadens IP1]|eukprot:XP_004185498.1 protein serine/threonine kinase, putative [Entamoeba invadens IP1]
MYCGGGQYENGGSCRACPVGTWSHGGYGITSCTPCSWGESAVVGSYDCVACKAGYYANSSVSSCPICPAGTFSPAGASKCTYCGGGQYQPSSGSSKCKVCTAGTYATNGAATCSNCPAGSYSLDGASFCPSCSAGYSSYSGSSSCYKCSAGTYATSGSSSCYSCSAGTYGPSSGASSCYSCSPGTYSSSGSTSCSSCPAGKSSNGGASSCTPCSAGTYSSSSGSTSCGTCSPGTYSSSGSTSCSSCPKGTFSNYGSSSCSNCPAGTYGSTTGLSSCPSCSAGYYSSSGSTSCSICSAGKYSSSGSSSCTSCSAGTYSSTSGSPSCTLCTAGKYSSSYGSTSCSTCPAGTFSSSGSSSCSVCSAGTYASSGASSCTKCSMGYYSSSSGFSTCISCPAGKYSSSTGSTSCSTCPAGKYSSSGASVCISCPSGQYSASSGSSICTKCPAGTYSSNGSSACSSCKDGEYSLSGSSICKICNSTCATCYITNGNCKTCKPGYAYTPSTGCTICQASYFSIGGTSSCSKCPSNTYSLEKSSECLSCSDKCATCNQMNGNCITCVNGYGLEAGVCKLCPAGTFANSSSCVTCGDMTYSLGAQTYCDNCDTICKTCDKTNGHCTSCYSGKGISGNSCVVCQAGYYSLNNQCEKCPLGTFTDSNGKDNCETCGDYNFVNVTGSTTCLPCDTLCAVQCEKTSGNCSTCVGGYVATEGVCKMCLGGTKSNSITNLCDKCPAGTYSNNKSSSCSNCKNLEFSLKGSSSCQTCNSVCRECNSTNGNCTACFDGYGISNSFSCEMCQEGTFSFDSKCTNCEEMNYQDEKGKTTCKKCNSSCSTCDKTNGKCTNCKAGDGFNKTEGSCTTCTPKTYSTGNTSECVSCQSECTNCFKETGYCSSCEDGFKTKENKCVSCSLNGNCTSCNTTGDEQNWVCKKCENGLYLDNNNCILCEEIAHCASCSQTQKECLYCHEDYVTDGNKCFKCEEGKVKNGDKTCIDICYLIPNCKNGYYDNATLKCTECFEPFELTSDSLSCFANKDYQKFYYDKQTNTFKENDVNCTNQIYSTCYVCQDSILLNGKCEKFDDNCKNSAIKGCDLCKDSILTSSNNCTKDEKCKYQLNKNDTMECLQCVNDTVCGLKEEECSISQNSYCYTTKEGSYTNKNDIIPCESGKVCALIDGKELDFECEKETILTRNNVCTKDPNCLISKGNYCVKCVDDYHIYNGWCELNNNDCDTQNRDFCVWCKSHIGDGHECYNQTKINCPSFNDTCVKCEENNYKTETKCELIEDVFPNCKNVYKMCVDCQENFILESGDCLHKNETNTSSETNETTKTTFKNENDSNCIEKTTKGCVRCSDTYYLKDYKCIKCEYPCVKCKNLTYCTGCDAYSYTNNKGECIEINDLLSKCDLVMATYTGCVVCKDGYMRSSDGKTCEKCHMSCKTCTNDGTCISCNNEYYRTATNNTKYCTIQSELNNCLNKTISGCYECDNGFYISNNLCKPCNEKCTTCTSLDYCTNCTENNVLLNDICTSFTEIPNCISASSNKCDKCAEKYQLNTNKYVCEDQTNYGILIGIPIASFVLILFIIAIIITILIFVILHKKEEHEMVNVCVFKIDRSNIRMTDLDKGIVSNKKQLIFGEGVLNPVEEEVRELICIGNTQHRNLKIQFTTKDLCDKFKVRTSPQIVNLKRGEACEFEVFLTLFCTTDLEDEILLISLDLKSGQKVMTPIKIYAKTELSTKLDYEEVKVDKKLGEGSFGIVYKGTYRGNVVAIKKMKQSMNEDGKEKEFRNEVSMLDKIRSDYIVHFYGAVFIPKKICMVTEFAQFGSLQDVLKRMKGVEVRMKLRFKVCLDAAQGIQYLHTNGILHRDIKPDNFLVFSLDYGDEITAKLTDFGSARNINLLMTNMTFTKGVGTPKYMAPEVLDRKKYKKAADVYSFAVTMFEVLGWCEAFDKNDERFKFAWNIADFTSAGKRLVIPETIPEQARNLIENGWKQDTKDRIPIETIIDDLQQFLK